MAILDSYLVAIALLLYIFFEVNYFLRFVYYRLYMACFKMKTKTIEDEGIVYGICGTTDLDFMLHMNNSRYLREMDFGRIDFYIKNGLYKAIRQCGGYMVQAACSVRYRKPVTLFQVFRVRSKLLYWDERNVYVEQRMETLSDDLVRAIVINKQTIVGTDLNRVFLQLMGHIPRPPSDLPSDLVKWIESNECSSRRLRRTAGIECSSPARQEDLEQKAARLLMPGSASLLIKEMDPKLD